MKTTALTSTKKLFTAAFIAISTFGHTPAHAFGGWVSSGGELLQDSNNPWFLFNVKTVHYCFVENTAGGFSASPSRARTLFKEALNYWKDEFKEGGNSFPIALGVASQDFVENQKCDNTEDLTVHLGFETLTPEQKTSLGPNLRRFLGLTVRTDYRIESQKQENKLRGKGFIFIASDQGANAFEGPKQAAKAPWSYDGLLLRIFAHELGHVFGISHTDAGVMGSNFSESLVMPRGVYLFKDSHRIQNFSKLMQESRRCDFSSTAAQWFELPVDAKCLRIQQNEKGLDIAYETADRITIPHGTLAFKDKNLASNFQILSTLYLPTNQTLIPNDSGTSYLVSSKRVLMNFLGTFIGPQTGKAKSAKITLSPNAIEILGINETDLESIFE